MTSSRRDTDRGPSWTRADQRRFEDGIRAELHELREDIAKVASRVTLILGGLGVLVFVVNVAIAIYLRSAGS